MRTTIKDLIFKIYLRLILRELPISVYIRRGLKVGKNFSCRSGCIIDHSHCWLISIDDDVTFSPRVHVLAHDASTKRALGYTCIGRVQIGSRVFVGAGAIILPNITIGDDVVIGAGSVVTDHIPRNSVAAGNPARVIGPLDVFLEKKKELMKTRPLFDESWTLRQRIGHEKKRLMCEALNDGIGFIE
jgi:maltose O-acetyltransferase